MFIFFRFLSLCRFIYMLRSGFKLIISLYTASFPGELSKTMRFHIDQVALSIGQESQTGKSSKKKNKSKTFFIFPMWVEQFSRIISSFARLFFPFCRCSWIGVLCFYRWLFLAPILSIYSSISTKSQQQTKINEGERNEMGGKNNKTKKKQTIRICSGASDRTQW